MDVVIKNMKNGTGLKAYCPHCKKLLRYAHGCNRGGLVYAEAAAREDLENHLLKCKKKRGEK